MAVEDAIWALQEHWADVIGRLGAERSAVLIRLIGELEGPGRPRALGEIADLLVEGLPREHPVRRALVGGTMLAPGTLDWPAVTRAFRELMEAAGFADAPGLSAAPDPPAAPDVRPDPGPGGGVLAAVTGRLLRAPALGEPDVRGVGADPGDPGLVRLTGPDGRSQWPAFQFGPGGTVPDVVRRVNLVLGAEQDPVGTSDWWLSRNAWLQDVPADLIGKVPDDLIVQAARAVGSEV